MHRLSLISIYVNVTKDNLSPISIQDRSSRTSGQRVGIQRLPIFLLFSKQTTNPWGFPHRVFTPRWANRIHLAGCSYFTCVGSSQSLLQAALFFRCLCSFLLSLMRLSASHVLGTGCHIRRCHPDGLLMMCGAEEVGRRVGLCPVSLSSASGDLCPSFQPGTPDEVFILFKSQLIFLGWGLGLCVWKAVLMHRLVEVVRRKNKKSPSSDEPWLRGVSYPDTKRPRFGGKH